MGNAPARRARRLVGCDYLHARPTNICPRQGGGRGYVAGPLFRTRASLCLGIAFPKLPAPNFLVDLLHFACVWVPGEGSDRLDASINRGAGEILSSRKKLERALPLWAGARPDAGNCLCLGCTCSDAHPRRFFSHRHHASRRRPLLLRRGRARSILAVNVHRLASILFRHGVREFSSLVN